MDIQKQIENYIASQPALKRSEIEVLHKGMLQAFAKM